MHEENRSLQQNTLEKKFMFSFLRNWAARPWVLGVSFHDDDLKSLVEYCCNETKLWT